MAHRIVQSIRNLFVYGGVERASFEGVREDLAHKNRSALLYTGSACAVLFLGMFLSTFASTQSSSLEALRLRSRILYLAIALLCLLIVLLTKWGLSRRRARLLPLCYLLLSTLFAAAIWIGTFNQPYYPSTTFCVFLVALPLLIIDRPYRLYLYLLGVCAAYLLCSFAAKAREVFLIDLLNCLCFFYLSVAVGLLIQNLRVSEAVQRKAAELQRDQDALTGLLNRAALDRAAGEAVARGQVSALLFLDIDDFKAINDTYGHVYGDAAIRAVAACLRSAAPDGTLIGRFGGDEFVLCMHRAAGRQDAAAQAQRIQQAVRHAVDLPSRTASITVSVGICMAGNGTSGYAELLSRADSALYQAKRLEKNQYCFSAEV